MAGTGVQIDLDTVEATAKKIHGLLDELTTATAKLNAVIQQVQPSVYGTDALGKALTGGSSSVGGLADHQKQVLAGIQDYLTNSTSMAQNLTLMCERHRTNDGQQADNLKGIGNNGDTTSPTLPDRDPNKTDPTPTPTDDPSNGKAYQDDPTKDPTYKDPTAPTLPDDSTTKKQPVDVGVQRGAGGGGHQLI
ncbi:hypothetical protein [Kitasatospora kifunensis]|uniref:ABC-type transporter Mla subunit MlaD n=1 Tax=Kitasatospora kifunensis TaxID=58351 RepID=A0A7W7R7Q5_KITKI|nr:hypothetical protein [Kitasatospora kifunensis]MBB4926844.1 ABC-type transporter Mla subunit MlaD [Kitasatospora kifunensis]